MGISAGGLKEVDSIHNIGRTMKIAPNARIPCARAFSIRMLTAPTVSLLVVERTYASSPRTKPNWITVKPKTITVRMTASAEA